MRNLYLCFITIFTMSVSSMIIDNLDDTRANWSAISDNVMGGISEVNFYELDDGFWVQKGSELGGPSGTDKFGSSIQLNGDGTVLVVGARGHNSDAGLVRVVEWNGNEIQHIRMIKRYSN